MGSVLLAMKPAIAVLTTILPVIAIVTLAQSAPTSPNLQGFRKWHRVTNRAFPMDNAVSGLCRMPPASMDTMNRIFPKHSDDYNKSIHSHQDDRRNFVHVYVNEIGRKSMSLKGPKFPVGTIIVKEKFPELKQPRVFTSDTNAAGPRTIPLDSSTVLTVMRKREAGFDSKNGDWEYFVGDPRFLQLSSPDAKTLKTCQSCHALYKDRDYVTKVYLITRDEQVTPLKSQRALKSRLLPH